MHTTKDDVNVQSLYHKFICHVILNYDISRSLHGYVEAPWTYLEPNCSKQVFRPKVEFLELTVRYCRDYSLQNQI